MWRGKEGNLNTSLLLIFNCVLSTFPAILGGFLPHIFYKNDGIFKIFLQVYDTFHGVRCSNCIYRALLRNSPM